MKRKLFFCVLFIFSALNLFAKNPELNPIRSGGYVGSVSLTSRVIFFGLETGHGCMINENHFVGFGIGYSYCPFIPKWPGFGDIFAEYKWYILDKRHTPTLGMRAGLSYHTEGHKLGNDATPSPLFQPNIGWDWNMAKYFSMNLSIGIDLRVEKNEYRTDIEKIPYIMLSWKF